MNQHREFSMPMWFVGLVLLLIEFGLYAWRLAWPAIERGDWWCALGWMTLLPLAVRFFVTYASYAVSRWKGVTLPASERLNPIAWLKFFLIECWHLCIQNLLLIPCRALFHSRSDRGVGPSGGAVILMQHGYVNNGAVWFFTARALEARGFRVFTVDQPAYEDIEHMGDRLAARVDELLALTTQSQLTLVAHSMGGLVCRAYLRRHGGTKIARLVTLGTPHHGTFHAYAAGGKNGVQMRPGNAWLASLNETKVSVPFTSIYSIHDTLVSPQDSSVMSGADNIQLSAVGHVSMPSGTIARAALLAVLTRVV